MRLLGLLLLTALLAFGADVAGKWKASIEGQNGPREVTFTFQVTDGKLTGTATGSQGEAPITEGKVEGDKVSFTVESGQFKAVLTGTVSGDDLKLTGRAGDSNFELAAKRVKE
jgi:hypothetical protein